jgi:hypothetical protein
LQIKAILDHLIIFCLNVILNSSKKEERHSFATKWEGGLVYCTVKLISANPSTVLPTRGSLLSLSPSFLLLPSPKPPQSQTLLLHYYQHSQPSLSLFPITTCIPVHQLHCLFVCIIRPRTIHITISITGLICTCTTIKITVCYHVDRCTKNKRMIRIPMCGLFLTCTENPFLFIEHTQHKIRAGA